MSDGTERRVSEISQEKAQRCQDRRVWTPTILAKGLRLKRTEDAEEGCQTMVGMYERKIYPSVDGVRNVIRLLGASNEKVRRLKGGMGGR